MDLNNYHFFNIDIVSLNLFSFMLGMVWAFFNQGVFGKRIALPIFLYFAGLAGWFALELYVSKHPTKKISTPTEQSQVTASDTLPKEWGITQEHLDKLLGKLPTYSQKEE